MSGNHLLPIYYNTCRLTPKRRKKKKVTEKEKQLILKHEKFLLKMGYRKNSPPPKTERVYESPTPLKPIESFDWSPCTINSGKPLLNSSYTIGQAYNKGNLVVLSKSESKDATTGKRR